MVSGTEVEEAWRTTHEPRRWRPFFNGEKSAIPPTSRSPTTMSARPATIGSTSLGTSWPQYWLSASVFTITSAPSFSAVSIPAWNAGGESLVVREAHEMVDAELLRHLDGAVGRAVVDDEPLHDVEAVDLAGEVGERLRELLGLVEAGDLDDELHLPLLPRLAWTQYPKAQVTVLAPTRRAHPPGAGGG